MGNPRILEFRSALDKRSICVTHEPCDGVLPQPAHTKIVTTERSPKHRPGPHSTMRRSASHHPTKRKPSGGVHYCVMNSPVGKLLLAGNQKGLSLVCFQDGAHPITPEPSWTYDEKPLQKPMSQLKAYFAGRRKAFSLKLKPEGTSFQLRVWKRLHAIPYGRTLSYGQIAKAIGKPQASRAVGAANGQNPLSIVVPCHRVIGSTGRLVGYGGGLAIKETLLSLERRYDLGKD